MISVTTVKRVRAASESFVGSCLSWELSGFPADRYSALFIRPGYYKHDTVHPRSEKASYPSKSGDFEVNDILRARIVSCLINA